MTSEEKRIYNDAWVSMRPTSSYGHYKVEAEVYGIKAAVTTTDSQLFDQWTDEETREQARQEAFALALDSIKEQAGDKYYRALYATNADPALCEDDDTAMMLAEALWLHDQELTEDDFEDIDEWQGMLAKLDLQDKQVDAVHRTKIDGAEALVCLDNDWDY